MFKCLFGDPIHNKEIGGIMLQGDLQKFELPAVNPENKHTSSQRILQGKIIPPAQHLLLISSDDWETFLLEWAHFQKEKYYLVIQLGGANDYGIDVACFYTDKGFEGEWDNFQCKYYKGSPLTPAIAIPEIGKILWHIFSQTITTPKKYYFFAPQDCGPSLKKLLLNAKNLKKAVLDGWGNYCAKSITSKMTINLENDFLKFFEQFDFSIFQYKPVAEVLEDHRKTPYYAARFGGGLKDRPPEDTPPEKISEVEVRYVEQLNEAYADHKNIDTKNLDIDDHPELKKHFQRQREYFYSAESLRSFARDSVPHGTFEELQEDMLDGVIDAAENDYMDGFERVKNVMRESRGTSLDANGLFQAIRVKDRYGVCHQLANADKLIWVKKND